MGVAYWEVKLKDAVLLFRYGIPAGLGFLGMTVVIDSIFWNRPLWPEGEVLWFNTILNKSSGYGTSPFLWYFYSAIPRGMAASVFLLPLGLFLDERVRKIIAPAILFVFLYSFLPHKELRFIIYVFPILNVPVATACYRLWENRGKSLFQYFLSIGVLGHLGVNVMFTLLLLCISGTNYPGGTAISHLHRLARDESYVNVHISNLAAQTGVSRFTQINDNWTYSKTENLLPGSQDMYEYTHIIAEAKSKFSHSLKPYTFTHDIIDTIEAFNQVSFNYLTIPPVKIKTKPVVFILKRKKNYVDMLNMRNFHEDKAVESQEEKTPLQSNKKDIEIEIPGTSISNESEFEEPEEKIPDSFSEEEMLIKNVPQAFSEEIISEETKVEENYSRQVLNMNKIGPQHIPQDSSEEALEQIILRPQFKNKKEIEDDTAKVTKPKQEILEKSQKKKKVDIHIPNVEEIDDLAAAKIEELKIRRSTIPMKKNNAPEIGEITKKGIKRPIDEKMAEIKKSEIENKPAQVKKVEVQENNETETNEKENEEMDLKQSKTVKEREVYEFENDEITEEVEVTNTFLNKIEGTRKVPKLMKSEKKDGVSIKTTAAMIKSKLKMEALELAAKKRIYEEKSDENKQQVKHNLKKLIQKYRRKKNDDHIITEQDEKLDEAFEGMIEDENNKQKDEIHKIKFQIMAIIENNPNIANKDLIKEKLQTTIINELIKVIDDKIVEKTGKQMSAKDDIRTKKLVEAIEMRKIKDIKTTNIVQSEETIDYDGKIEIPFEPHKIVKEEVTASKIDREEKIREAQAKIEDIMNIIDEIVETIEIHNIE